MFLLVAVIYNSQDMETNKMSINRGMDEEDVGIYITQGVLCYLPSFVNLWNICVCVCVCVCVCACVVISYSLQPYGL